MTRVLLLVPVVLLTIVVGEHLHHRIPERPFRRAVFALLLVGGVALAVRSLA
jgi:uncharacterized membrane protein YfcA